jgi:hypothetical protein
MNRVAHTTDALYFRIGDYLAGALTGGVTALAVRMLVGPQWDMVVAMLVGMATGMSVHLVLLLVLVPLFGDFEIMMPGALIGMYGGMLFGMRDSMQQAYVSLGSACAVGVLWGVLVVLAVRWLDHQLKGEVFVASETSSTSEGR